MGGGLERQPEHVLAEPVRASDQAVGVGHGALAFPTSAAAICCGGTKGYVTSRMRCDPWPVDRSSLVRRCPAIATASGTENQDRAPGRSGRSVIGSSPASPYV
jgi:hypothetical protein